MIITIANKPPCETDVTVRFVHAPATPTPGGLRADPGDLRLVESSDDSATPPTLLISVGDKNKCNAEILRKASGIAAKWLIGHKVRNAHVDLSEILRIPPPVKTNAVCEGLALGSYRFTIHRSNNAPDELSCTLFPGRSAAGVKAAIERATSITEAVNLARSWGHEIGRAHV